MPVTCLLLVIAVAGCASRSVPEASGSDPQEIAQQAKARRDADAINTKLAEQSSRLSSGSSARLTEYRIGPGDALEIDVFQVEDLSGTERVNSRGAIMMPLLGSIHVAGKSVAEVEAELTEILGRDYIQEPQVSVFVSDYRSAEIVVAGAVKNPAVYSVTRPHTLLEILLLAGGVSANAGYKVNVHTSVTDSETGKTQSISVLADLRTIMDDYELNQHLILKGGDSVFVQSAGYVYVQGAVARSGSFKIEGEINVLKALAIAGGVNSVADHDDIKVFRETRDGSEVFELNYNDIRRDRSTDMALTDGDLVVVGNNALKSAFFGTWGLMRGLWAFAL